MPFSIDLTTPKNIDAAVVGFCSSICPNSTPVFVEVDALSSYPPDECFYNVPTHVKTNGGELLIGWMIWYAPRKFIEAVFHCIWKSPNGALVDVTPKASGEQKILFLPDKQASWNKRRVSNRRKALTDDPLIELVIRKSEASDQLNARYMNSEGRPEVPAPLVMKLEQQFQIEYQELTQSKQIRNDQKHSQNTRPKRNHPCPCGSGRKYKKCHGLRAAD